MEKVGLVCEGGGTKGAYTAGVLACFLDQNITFPYSVGISSGAINLMNFLSKQQDRLKDVAVDIASDKKNIGFSAFWREKQIYGLNRVYDLMETRYPYNYKEALENPMRFEVGLYNMKTGIIEYFDKNNLNNPNFVKASCALLLLAKPLSFNNGEYMDGGLITMIPIERSIEQGNTKHIFISTKEENFERKPAPKWQRLLVKSIYSKQQDAHIVENLAKRHIRYQEQWNKIKILEQEGKALILRPSKNMNISRSTQDKGKLEIWFQLGYEDTLRRIDEIRAFMNEKS